MTSAVPPALPLISVIIPSYNYGHFLAEAIESVLRQTYLAKEIIVVDDGSTDDTCRVAAQYPGIIYVYQKNQGLSAARNAGIRHSCGEYLVFLDADDWLLPEALAVNAACLQHNPHAAFVSGSYVKVYADGREPEEEIPFVAAHPYKTFLVMGNYIGMIAAVMFARWVFSEFTFDVTLTNCEDYDLYLNITRHYPIAQHSHPVAVYRLHNASMSAQVPVMLIGALKVLHQQRTGLRGIIERAAYYRGVYFWTTYYLGHNRFKLLIEKIPGLQAMVGFLWTHARYKAR